MSYGLISRSGLRARAQVLRDFALKDFAAVPRLVPKILRHYFMRFNSRIVVQ
jgi:hypothetical protein